MPVPNVAISENERRTCEEPALNSTTTTTGLATDLAIVAGTIVVLIVAAVYALRRQSSVLATI